MAQEIVVVWDGVPSRFELARLEREKLYGKKVMMLVDGEGQKCEAALLSRDGSMLVPPGGTSYLSVTETFDSVERGELQAVDGEGRALASKPSTLGAPQEMRQVTPSRVLECQTSTIYELAPSELSEGLRQALEQGAIFEFPFSYRADYQYDSGFLIKNEAGFFALIGEEVAFPFLQRETQAEEEDVPQADDDLDFSMM